MKISDTHYFKLKDNILKNKFFQNHICASIYFTMLP